ncbi:EAL domain-containing protein [Qipengyuania sp. 483]
MRRPSIHIVDDDEDICVEICSALSAFDYECSWANSAARLTGLEGREPDILLLDLNLPDIDGFEIIKRLADREHQPHLIVASGEDQRIIETAIRYSKKLGLDVLGSLHKPYPLSSLFALIESSATAARRTPANDIAAICELAQNGALERNQRTVFQSKRRLSDGAVVGYEALLRISINGTPISPEAVFEPAVNLTTQIAVTKAVLDDALHFGSNLRGLGTPVPVSINCTPEILCTPDLPDMVTRAMKDWEMPAASLIIEITEHVAGQSFDAVASAACRLAMRGCGISIDDFGRGSTSLERLFDLPLAELKIDKQIFWKCFDGNEPPELLQEVIRYCEKRNIISTVEGIETASHLDHALALGANCGQGFFWDRPSIYDLEPTHHSKCMT